MDTHTSSLRRALKLAQEQEVAEDWRWPRNERETELDVLQALRNKGARKRREKGCARHAAQTASERQATSQWKSTHEHRAETPEEKETRNGSSAILHFERGDFYTGLPHIYFPIHSLIPVLSLPKRDWIQRYLKSTM